MGKTIELQLADGGRIGAWRADPAGTPLGGVVIVQEIFGVNPHIRSVVERYAAAGFAAIAPAVFDPAERGVELGYDAAGRDKGLQLVARIGLDGALAGVQAAAAALSGAGRVGVVGYCWGGTVAYLAAIRLGLPAVSYYGGRNTQLVGEAATAPLQFHYALRDAHITEADREAVRRANPDADFHVYDADHGFNCDARAAYDAPSAALAQQRSEAFLRAVLSR